jgi:hypothetical protein
MERIAHNRQKLQQLRSDFEGSLDRIRRRIEADPFSQGC